MTQTTMNRRRALTVVAAVPAALRRDIAALIGDDFIKATDRLAS